MNQITNRQILLVIIYYTFVITILFGLLFIMVVMNLHEMGVMQYG